MCRTVVSIAMESPFTVRRTRLFCHLGAHRRSAARVAELQVEALQVSLREWRGEVLDEVRLHLKHPAKSPWGRIDDDVEALPSVPVRLQIKGAVSQRVVASNCHTEAMAAQSFEKEGLQTLMRVATCDALPARERSTAFVVKLRAVASSMS